MCQLRKWLGHPPHKKVSVLLWNQCERFRQNNRAHLKMRKTLLLTFVTFRFGLFTMFINDAMGMLMWQHKLKQHIAIKILLSMLKLKFILHVCALIYCKCFTSALAGLLTDIFMLHESTSCWILVATLRPFCECKRTLLMGFGESPPQLLTELQVCNEYNCGTCQTSYNISTDSRFLGSLLYKCTLWRRCKAGGTHTHRTASTKISKSFM